MAMTWKSMSSQNGRSASQLSTSQAELSMWSGMWNYKSLGPIRLSRPVRDPSLISLLPLRRSKLEMRCFWRLKWRSTRHSLSLFKRWSCSAKAGRSARQIFSRRRSVRSAKESTKSKKQARRTILWLFTEVNRSRETTMALDMSS